MVSDDVMRLIFGIYMIVYNGFGRKERAWWFTYMMLDRGPSHSLLCTRPPSVLHNFQRVIFRCTLREVSLYPAASGCCILNEESTIWVLSPCWVVGCWSRCTFVSSVPVLGVSIDPIKVKHEEDFLACTNNNGLHHRLATIQFLNDERTNRFANL